MSFLYAFPCGSVRASSLPVDASAYRYYRPTFASAPRTDDPAANCTTVTEDNLIGCYCAGFNPQLP